MRDHPTPAEAAQAPGAPAPGAVRAGAAKAPCASTPGVTSSHDWEEIGHGTYVCRSCFARSSSRV